MAVSAELKIILTAVNNAKAQLTSLVNDLAALSEGAKATDTSFGEISEAAKKIDTVLTSLGASVKFLTGGFLALKSVQTLKGFADDAARAQTLEVVLFQIGANAGYTRKELRETDKAVQELGITAQASRQSLSQFIQSGLNLADAGKLARAAQDLAVIAGENSSETFQRLITNIQQADVDGLRFVGITVDLEAASAKYADSLGITAGALTRQQQQQATLNAVLEKSVDLQGTYEAALDTTSKKLSSLDRIQTNLKTSLGQSLLPAYTALVDEFSKFLVELTKVSDGFNKNQTAGQALGETVRSIASTISSIILTLVEYKDVLKVVGEAYGIGKIIQYGTSLVGLLTTVPKVTSALGGLRLAIAALGGPISLLITALALVYTSSETGKNIIDGFGLTLLSVGQRAVYPLAVGIAVLKASYDGLKAAFSGGSGAKAFEESLSSSMATIDANLKKTTDGIPTAFGKAFDSASSGAKAGIDKTNQSVTQLIDTYKKQGQAVQDLLELYNKQKDAGDDVAAKETANKVKLAKAEESRTKTLIASAEVSGKLNKADQDRIETLNQEEADIKKAEKAHLDYADAVAAARKELGLSSVNVTANGIFTAENTTRIEQFNAVYTQTVADVKAGSKDAKVAVKELQVAFENLAKTAKTSDDLKSMSALITELKTHANKTAEALVPEASKILAKTKTSISSSRGSSRSNGDSERKAQIKAQSDEELAELTRVASIEKSTNEARFNAVDREYKRGIVSVSQYYNAKRALIQGDSLIEVQALRNQINSVNGEIANAKRLGLTTSDIMQLKTKRLDLETKITTVTQANAEKVKDINADELASQREVSKLTQSTTKELLEAQGKTLEAKRIEIAQLREDKLREVKGNSDEANQQRADIEAIIVLRGKQAEFDAAEIEANTVLSRLRLAQETVDINRKNGLLDEAQARQAIINLNKKASDDLDAILPKLKEAADVLGKPAQDKVAEWANQIAQSRIVVDEVAVRINGAFKTGITSLFSDVITQAKTAQEAVRDFALTFLKSISDVASQKLTEGLFGSVTDGNGGIGGFFSGLFGGNDGSKKKGDTPLDPLYTQDASTAAGKAVGDLVDPTKVVTETFFDRVKTGFLGLVDTGKGVFEKIGGFLTSLFSSSGGGSGGGFGGILQAGLSLFGFAEGGLVSGAGTGTSDSIVANLSNGEHVTRASQTAKWLPLLNAINSGAIDNFSGVRVPSRPYFAEGGLVDKASQTSNSPQSGQQNASGQNTRIVNVIDPAMAGEYLQSSAGEKVLLNFIGRNKSGIRSALS